MNGERPTRRKIAAARALISLSKRTGKPVDDRTCAIAEGAYPDAEKAEIERLQSESNGHRQWSEIHERHWREAMAERDRLRDGIQALADAATEEAAQEGVPSFAAVVDVWHLRALLNPTPEGTP